MNIAICDDDKEICDYLYKVLSSYYTEKGYLFAINIFNSGEEIINSSTIFDIVFMDVEMKGLDGIATSAELKKKNRDLIILIITSYNEYLDDAFSINAFRFLSKPIDVKRLYKALDDADSALSNERIVVYDALSNEKVVIYKNNIIYVEICGKKTRIFTTNDIYVSNQHMSFWREKLSTSSFIVPHSSYIANMDYVINHNRTQITLARFDEKNNPIEEYVIPVAPRKQTEVKMKFLSFLESR